MRISIRPDRKEVQITMNLDPKKGLWQSERRSK